MKTFRFASLLALGLGLAACRSTPDYGRPLPAGWPALIELAPGEARPSVAEEWYARDEILPALERSIDWTASEHARQFFPMEGVSHERALASLEAFRAALLESNDPQEFERRIAEEFSVYKSAGWNGLGGGVLFTGYCTPILSGSLQPDSEHDYPLYALPEDLVKGPRGEILGRRTVAGGLEPYPTRRVIEASNLFAGKQLELVWLRDPLDAYIAHVNGSAFVELEDGTMLKLGYAGNNGADYKSLGAELVADGRMRRDDVSLANIRKWAARNPGQVQAYLDRNPRYVFFAPLDGNPRGSLNLEVEAGRSIATDKSIFPRGALTFVDTSLPAGAENPGRVVRYERFLFDQDTGGAIRTAGRADIYLGIGPEAERMAGRTKAEGQLYYYFLDEDALARRRSGS